MSLYRKTSEPYKPPPTPFAGFLDGVPARSAAHVLVTGLTGLGKVAGPSGPEF
ncbi:hypothetical protein [Gordonia jacobaea]|uniref:hypothetical protein n=1 Tax=Gordonia jacobaea TaxID=122202 RepID=UPI0022E15705|nr:hypothetical protein [Gordonia jacobaea]